MGLLRSEMVVVYYSSAAAVKAGPPRDPHWRADVPWTEAKASHAMPWKLRGTLEERTRKAVKLGQKAKLRGMDGDREVAEWLQSVKDGEGRPGWGPISEDVKAHCRRMAQKPPVTRPGQVALLATMLHAVMKGRG